MALAMIPVGGHAHDPVFGLGPHTLYKGGYEVHLGAHREKGADERETEAELELKYGITADWVAGVGIPYVRHEDHHGETESGRGSTGLSTKYRFWRNDMPGAQESAAVMAKTVFDDGKVHHGHAGAEADGNDYLMGVAYGYEGLKWYRWASLRRRFNSESASGATRPDLWKIDVVGGIRPRPADYYRPDLVLMLELNGEVVEHTSRAGEDARRRIGGQQWFLSPGLMWTYRNFAVKSGVQLPVYDDLARDREADDYRALLELEWHL